MAEKSRKSKSEPKAKATKARQAKKTSSPPEKKKTARRSPRKAKARVEPETAPAEPPMGTRAPARLEDSQNRLQESLDGFFLRNEEGPFEGGMAVRSPRLAQEREYLSFRLSNEIFAVDIQFLREIIKPPVATPVPRTEALILGVFSLRGDILPLVDLRRFLRLDEAPVTRASRVLVMQLPRESVGLLVDQVRHVLSLTDDDIEPPPAVFGRMETEHLVGVGRYEGEMITLIDLREAVRLDPYVNK